MEMQIFILDTQIYSIRCMTGEVVEFHALKTGNPAKEEEPLVIFQKMRFIDEELGRYAGLYHWDGDEGDKKDFLEVLKCRDDILDLFAPPGKTLSVLRNSATDTFHAVHPKIKDMMATYEKFHSGQIALMLRNGENVYIAWLDENRFRICDGTVFYNPGQDTREYAEEDEYAAKKTTKEEAASRFFIFSILKGVVDSGKLVTFPEKVEDIGSSPYIVFSLADGWLTDSRYGTLESMLERSGDIEFKEGSNVYVWANVGKRYSVQGDAAYNNERGIGDKNRTRGVVISSGIHSVNKVVEDFTIEYVIVKRLGKWTADGPVLTDEIVEKKTATRSIPYEVYSGDDRFTAARIKADPLVYMKASHVCEESVYDEKLKKTVWRNKWEYEPAGKEANTWTAYRESINSLMKKWKEGKLTEEEMLNTKVYQYCLESARIKNVQKRCFVSVEMTGHDPATWNETKYHVNMQFYGNEAVNLDYLCSSWIRYVIMTKQVGDLRIWEERFHYNELLKPLRIILEWLEKKEAEKKALLSTIDGAKEWMDTTPDWDAAVCEWQIKNRQGKFGIRAARKFWKEHKAGEQ